MNSLLRTLYSICFLLIVTSQLHAQQTWSLQQCIDHALKNNISVKQSEVAVELANINLTQKKLQMAPTLNATASHNYNFGRSVDPFSYTFTTEQIQSDNFSLNTNLTLFNGFQLQNELKQSRLDYISSKYDLEKIKNDISLNVVTSYLQVLYAQEQLAVAKANYDQSEKQRLRTKALADAGSLTQGNLLDADAQLATDELSVINADNALTIAKLTLSQLLEVAATDTINVEEPQSALPDLSILAQTPQMIYGSAEKSLPELQGSIYKVESAEKGVSIARSGRSPRLSFFGSLSTGYSSATQRLAGQPVFVGLEESGITNKGDTVFQPVYSSSTEKTPFNDQINQNYGKALGFSLNIPLFNGWTVGSSVNRAKLNLKNAEFTADLLRKQVFKSIQQAYADATGAQKKYMAAQKNVDALNASFGYTDRKYNAGLLSSLDYLTVKNNLARAQSDFLQAKYDYIFRVKVLDFYAGRPLTL